MNTTYDAIVLLGFSGVGKDTAFATLDKLLPNTFVNAKFSLLTKTLTARAFGLTLDALENKTRRNQPEAALADITPMDVLTVLYRGCTPEFTRAGIQHLFNQLSNDCIPVFTDIRRHEEAQAVKDNFSYPMFVYLWSSHISDGVNDSKVEQVAMVNTSFTICRDNRTPTEVAKEILELLK